MSTYRSQSSTFSSCKHHNTAKGLVGISPNGTIIYAESFSDRKKTKGNGIYDLLEAGDSIIPDRGFTLEDDLPEGILLNNPPFLNREPQLGLSSENEARKICPCSY